MIDRDLCAKCGHARHDHATVKGQTFECWHEAPEGTDECHCPKFREPRAAPSPSPSSAPRPDMEQAARYLDNLGYGMAAHVLRAAPASPQGERERALRDRIRDVLARTRDMTIGHTDDHLVRAVEMAVERMVKAEAASSPHYAEKGD